MPFSLRFADDECGGILVLVAVYILSRIPFISYLPLFRDEGIYSMMVMEQLNHPSIIPTLFGYHVAWKPVLFFWIYGMFSHFSLPLELMFRLPSFIFGLLTIPFLYKFLRNANLSRVVSFFSVLVFLLSYASFYSDLAVLTDCLFFFLACVSLYLYSETNFGSLRFLAAGFTVFMAFFIKVLLASVIPVLALAFFYFNDKKVLRDPLFLLSLLVVPLALTITFIILSQAGFGSQFTVAVLGYVSFQRSFSDLASIILSSTQFLFPSLGIWFFLSIFGFYQHWKGNLFMSFWYLLTIFPLIFGSSMPWYYLPVLPAISYFTVQLLTHSEGKEKIDKFFLLIFGILAIANVSTMAFIHSSFYHSVIAEKEAGLLLAGKSNVLVIGGYAPSLIAYKTITEEQETGKSSDLGWILGANMSTDQISGFLSNYYSRRYPVVDGSFFTMYANPNMIFRKDSNISGFDYIVLAYSPPIPVNGTVIYNGSEISVYRVK